MREIKSESYIGRKTITEIPRAEEIKIGKTQTQVKKKPNKI